MTLQRRGTSPWPCLIGLALAALLAGCCCPGMKRTTAWTSGGSSGAAPSAPGGALTGETSREVAALWFSGGLGSAKGGSSKVKVTLTPVNAETATVSFTETEVGGNGDMWRSAGWMASCVASMTTGRALNTYKVDYAVEGMIDGPSAGGLLTVAVLSALTGKDLKSDVTMTGTINPDGTIGPVGGIPHKMEGAKAAGRTKMLIPAGQRNADDLSGDEPLSVDVVAKGKEIGLEIVEVATVADAYRELTGAELAYAAPPTTVPRPESDAYARITKKAEDWIARAEAEVDKCAALSPAVIEQLATEGVIDLSELDAQYAKAQEYLKDGQSAAAYDAAFQAALQAAGIYQVCRVAQDWAAAEGSADALLRIVNAAAPEQQEIDRFISDLAAKQPESVSDVIALSDAYSTGMGAVGLLVYARQAQQVAVETDSDAEAAAALLTMAVIYGLIDTALDCARDRLDIGFGLGGPSAPSDASLKAWAETMRHAASANLTYFDKTIIDQAAQQAGVHTAAAKASFMAQDSNYMLAVGSLNALEGVKELIGEGEPETERATLGISTAAFTLTSGLVAQYYSLGGKRDPDTGRITVGSQKMLIGMLDQAEGRTKAELEQAAKAGIDITIPYGYYECGKVYRETSGDDLEAKIDALRCFWQAASYARVASLLAQPQGNR